MGKPSNGYLPDLFRNLLRLGRGMLLTGRHLWQARRRSRSVARLDVRDPDYFRHQEGITTLTYPHETMPVPENGRYKLDCEIDDCIVCDKCVKVCPVDCITIDPIRAPAEFGKTSDGTSKRIYAAKFDIDMAKCCFCGLCTTVCPTECLTMTPEFGFSTQDLTTHRFEFADLTEEEAQLRRREWEEHLARKAAETPKDSGTAAPSSAPKPVMRPQRPKLS